ncbi:hypothetical protein DRP04_11990 [Archaeoglobales archaeon]|nr:MAG: hypothetical protein DRP04_11990 [Archaeoglobales archaeon]
MNIEKILKVFEENLDLVRKREKTHAIFKEVFNTKPDLLRSSYATKKCYIMSDDPFWIRIDNIIQAYNLSSKDKYVIILHVEHKSSYPISLSDEKFDKVTINGDTWYLSKHNPILIRFIDDYVASIEII